MRVAVKMAKEVELSKFKNKKCLKCQKTCKQYDFIKLIKCPLYVKIDTVSDEDEAQESPN